MQVQGTNHCAFFLSAYPFYSLVAYPSILLLPRKPTMLWSCRGMSEPKVSLMNHFEVIVIIFTKTTVNYSAHCLPFLSNIVK